MAFSSHSRAPAPFRSGTSASSRPRCLLTRAAAATTEQLSTAPELVRVGLVQRGCPKNTVDGEVMLGHLAANGYAVSDNLEDAEVLIVNTCSFVDEAKAESLEVWRRPLRWHVSRPVSNTALSWRLGAETADHKESSQLLVSTAPQSTYVEHLRLPAAPSWLLRCSSNRAAVCAGSTKQGCSGSLLFAGERQACRKHWLLLIPSPTRYCSPAQR